MFDLIQNAKTIEDVNNIKNKLENIVDDDLLYFVLTYNYNNKWIQCEIIKLVFIKNILGFALKHDCSYDIIHLVF